MLVEETLFVAAGIGTERGDTCHTSPAAYSSPLLVTQRRHGESRAASELNFT